MSGVAWLFDVGTEIATPRVHVLPEEGDLADAGLGEMRDLRNDLPRSTALLAATNGGDDAVRAGRVAPHRHLNPRLKATLAVNRKIGGKVVVRAEATLLDRVAPAQKHLIDQLGA